MKTLVLGGTGFLGRRLVERLDRQVITLSRHAPATLLPNETHVALDIFNAPALKKEMLEEVDSIVHCLGAVSPLPYKNLKFSSNRTVEWSDLMKINCDSRLLCGKQKFIWISCGADGSGGGVEAFEIHRLRVHLTKPCAVPVQLPAAWIPGEQSICRALSNLAAPSCSPHHCPTR